MFNIALNSMLALFSCLLIGLIGTRRKVFNEQMVDGFNKLLLTITVPAMFINAMNIEIENDLLKNGVVAFIAGFIYHILALIVAYVLAKIFRININYKSLWLFGLTFANIAFLGFPLINDLYGSEGIFYCSLFNISFSVFVFTLGVFLMNSGNNTKISIKSVLFNPPLIGVAIGIIILVLPFNLPIFLDKTVSMLGAITPPLSMIIVGSTLAYTKLTTMFKAKILYGFSLVKLVIIPVIVYLLANAFIDNEMLVVMITVLSGTPSAALTTILAHKYNQDSVLASEMVFITTMISVITLPLILKIIV